MKLRTEATVTYNAIGQPDWINPRGQTAKRMEMSIRRAAALDKLMGRYTQREPVSAPVRPPRPYDRAEEKLAEECVGDRRYWQHALWSTTQEYWTWRWAYQHWRDGGLRRSMDALSEMLPAENAQRVEQLTLGD